ncbi:DNA topoisomerase III [Brumicola nitratireducens]|uniref:DNA topoisomerase 3 n=1 Tax=Glaciecola nitratireducens (strain JCM 12485 / KCTC 12276 / FR1064) TaxID=1085623 RepID=G4QGA0_GLANF|nr:DNA topoisomerase III [Glaciecola nitratireducens]AEP29425.1 DNA topoisomerase III [Glaciecola nitratireducens FR1064]
MIVYIAEKPSLGRAIATGFSGKQQKREGYIELDNGDCVTWCVGHLLEQAEPDKYDAAFAKWSLQHLPIVPDKWQLVPKKNTQKQLTVVKRLLKKATHIVNAGDPDREGQLLVDEVITYCGVKASIIENAGRLLINDLNTSAVKKALQNMRTNREFLGLSISALARSRADWLYGLNLTRAYTLLGQRGGYSGVLSVGRVQTPVLGLVVRRDQEIAHFVSKPFYEVIASLESQNKKTFNAKWQPSKACEPYQDEEGRVLSRKLAQTVVNKTRGQQAKVTDYKVQNRQSPPPLPFSLSVLQIEASKRFNLSPKMVLDVCQSLYEKHQLITYPRSDSRYLPKDQFGQASNVLGAIKSNVPNFASAVDNANPKLKSKAWNDSKVDAHHAIIPTNRSKAIGSFTQYEGKIYQLIANQYLMQFYGPHKYQEQVAKIDIAGGEFVAKGKSSQDLGWLALTKNQNNASDDNKNDTLLPQLNKGELLKCTDSQLMEKQTSPPKHFTEATLLAAMTGISRYVQDRNIKLILKETDGLGTEATRATIIDLLFKRQFMQKVGKEVHATETGKALINALPSETTYPDMTATWEADLDKIAQRQLRYDGFMQPLTESIARLIDNSQQLDSRQFAGLKSSKPTRKKRYFKKKSS